MKMRGKRAKSLSFIWTRTNLIVMVVLFLSAVTLGLLLPSIRTNIRSKAAFQTCASLGGVCTARADCPLSRMIKISCKGNQVCCRPAAPTVPPGTPVPPPQTYNFSLFPVASFTPNGRGSVSLSVTKNPNGYWDILITQANFQKLEPQRTYQLHLCGDSGCSSHSSARFVTNALGSGSLANVAFTHNQWNNPANKLVVYEYLSSGPIPTDPKSCPMISLASTPCLKGGVLF